MSEPPRIARLAGAKGHDLAQGVYPGIGPTGRPHPHRLVEKTGQDGFQPALEGFRVGL